MAAITNPKELAVEFGNVTEANLDQLRKLNISTFPVRYNDKYYQNVLNTPPEVTQVKAIQSHAAWVHQCRC